MGTVSIGLAMILIGLAGLYFLSLRKRPFDTALVVIGIALVGCGIAAFRDGVEGTSRITWIASEFGEGQAAPVKELLATTGPASGRASELLNRRD